MAKSRVIEQQCSDDDSPEVVSQSVSRASARRDSKAIRTFDAQEKARKKERNRERDRKMKERALTTRKNKRPSPAKLLGEGSVHDAIYEREDGGHDAESNEEGANHRAEDRARERMLRAMHDAAEEDVEEEEEGNEFQGFRGMDSDVDMSPGDRNGVVVPNNATEDEDESTDGEKTFAPVNNNRFSQQAQYLSDDLFITAFASQKSNPTTAKPDHPNQCESTRKRVRNKSGRSKNVVVGRTIRTLSRLSDPKSKAIVRTLPPKRSRTFFDRSLAMKGKQAMLKAKQRGWERRPANIGTMKPDGAPIGFLRGVA
ncbi:hypothetical protein ID866_6655 [Astraeus odoratus]|nr:hypothetical protein ID866_6655 [Astraeus odoratus]